MNPKKKPTKKSDSEAGFRQCVVTRERCEAGLLIRFVQNPDGEIIPDLAHKLPGRGAWVKAERAQIIKAFEKGHLARALMLENSENSPRSDEMLELLEKLLLKRATELLAIGRKSGVVIGGSGKIKAEKNAIIGLVIASDASARETQALLKQTRPHWQSQSLTGEMLGSIFGRPSLAFVAVLKGSSRLANRLHDELKRLELLAQI